MYWQCQKDLAKKEVQAMFKTKFFQDIFRDLEKITPEAVDEEIKSWNVTTQTRASNVGVQVLAGTDGSLMLSWGNSTLKIPQAGVDAFLKKVQTAAEMSKLVTNPEAKKT